MTGNYNDAWVIGRDGGSASMIQNGGTVTYNPSNRDAAYVGASLGGGAVTASYLMNDGTLEMSGMRLGVALGPITASLTQNGGVINVRQLDLGANVNTGTAIYDLADGVMTIGGGGITSTSKLYEINLAGGTIAAAANWASALNISLTEGDVKFDTEAHAITLSGNLSGTGGLRKRGTGKLILNGSAEYDGPTVVEAGTLGGIGLFGISEVTVAADAAISPGTITTGSFLAETIDFASGSFYKVKIDSGTGTADELDVLGAVDITGANVSFSEIGTGFIMSGTELFIVSSGSLTGNFAGYPEGATVSIGANTFTIHYTSKTVSLISTTVAIPYDTWAVLQGLDGSPGKDPAFDADPENDGLANGLEWVLGGDPLASDGSLLNATATAVDGITLTFTREETSLGNVDLFVQYNTGLDGVWTDVPVTKSGGSYPNGVTVSVNEAANPDAVTVTIPAANAAGGKLFSRLRAVMP